MRSSAASVRATTGAGRASQHRVNEARSIERAYAQAGYQVGTVGLIEAHGTSTKVGDVSLATAFGGAPSGDLVAVGSVKSQIGHLKAVAGIAGLIKTTLALREATLPERRIPDPESQRGLGGQPVLRRRRRDHGPHHEDIRAVLASPHSGSVVRIGTSHSKPTIRCTTSP